jgi:hypothetical protein
MQSFLLWPTLAILAGAAAAVSVVQESTKRSVLCRFALSPIAVGLAPVVRPTGIR